MMAALATSFSPLWLPLLNIMTHNACYEHKAFKKWKNNNKPMKNKRAFAARHGGETIDGRFLRHQGFFGQGFRFMLSLGFING
jgi:hypothetical protein